MRLCSSSISTASDFAHFGKSGTLYSVGKNQNNEPALVEVGLLSRVCRFLGTLLFRTDYYADCKLEKVCEVAERILYTGRESLSEEDLQAAEQKIASLKGRARREEARDLFQRQDALLSAMQFTANAVEQTEAATDEKLDQLSFSICDLIELDDEQLCAQKNEVAEIGEEVKELASQLEEQATEMEQLLSNRSSTVTMRHRATILRLEASLECNRANQEALEVNVDDLTEISGRITTALRWQWAGKQFSKGVSMGNKALLNYCFGASGKPGVDLVRSGLHRPDFSLFQRANAIGAGLLLLAHGAATKSVQRMIPRDIRAAEEWMGAGVSPSA